MVLGDTALKKIFRSLHKEEKQVPLSFSTPACLVSFICTSFIRHVVCFQRKAIPWLDANNTPLSAFLSHKLSIQTQASTMVNSNLSSASNVRQDSFEVLMKTMDRATTRIRGP